MVALIVLTGRAARLLRNRRPSGAAGRRLAIRAALAIDPRRRLLLVACDDSEILLLTGGAQDLVVGWLPAGRGGTLAPRAGRPGMSRACCC